MQAYWCHKVRSIYCPTRPLQPRVCLTQWAYNTVLSHTTNTCSTTHSPHYIPVYYLMQRTECRPSLKMTYIAMDNIQWHHTSWYAYSYRGTCPLRHDASNMSALWLHRCLNRTTIHAANRYELTQRNSCNVTVWRRTKEVLPSVLGTLQGRKCSHTSMTMQHCGGQKALQLYWHLYIKLQV